MLQHYQRLFAYDKWANQRILIAMKQLPEPDERCLQLFSHIIAAQEIWFDRIMGNTNAISPFLQRSLQENIEASDRLSAKWDSLLTANLDFERGIIYRNMKGEQFTSQLKDILTHVINHSTYHRGQIVASLKGKIEKLPVTDFIVFARE